MYFVYVLKNEQTERIYIGMSADVERRLTEHNNGNVRSTRAYRPWILLFKKEVGERKLARQEEKRLKSGYGREEIKKYMRP